MLCSYLRSAPLLVGQPVVERNKYKKRKRGFYKQWSCLTKHLLQLRSCQRPSIPAGEQSGHCQHRQTSDSNDSSRWLNNRCIVPQRVEMVSLASGNTPMTWQDAFGCDALQLQPMPPTQTMAALRYTLTPATPRLMLLLLFGVPTQKLTKHTIGRGDLPRKQVENRKFKLHEYGIESGRIRSKSTIIPYRHHPPPPTPPNNYFH